MSLRSPVLVVAHRFAPYSRVGAYRWVRLSARLARLGHPVHVLTVEWPRMEPMDWLAEADEPGVQIHRTRSGYPQKLQYRTWPGPLDRTFGRAVRLAARRFPAFDEAAHWGRYLVPEALRLVDSHDIRTVIATGGPFSTLVHSARLKEARRHVKLILDFRDPWFLSEADVDGSPWGSGYRDALTQADCLVAVTPEMTQLIAEHTWNRLTRIETIENGVELARLRSLAAERDHPPEVDFVYTGSVFSGRHVPLLPFFAWMRQRRAQGRPVRVRLIGRVERSLPGLCEDLAAEGDLQILDPVPQEKAFEHVLRARRTLHMNARATNDTQVSTKLVEYAALGRPCVSLNYGGAVDRLMRDAALGWSIDPSRPGLNETLDRILAEETEFHPQLARFDFDALAKRYSDLIATLQVQ